MTAQDLLNAFRISIRAARKSGVNSLEVIALLEMTKHGVMTESMTIKEPSPIIQPPRNGEFPG